MATNVIASGAVFGSYTDPPGAVPLASGFISDAAGINPNSVIVGIFFDASGVEHGYIRTPWRMAVSAFAQGVGPFATTAEKLKQN